MLSLAKLSDTEISNEFIIDSLNKIFGWIRNIEELDFSNIEPLTHLFSENYLLREDIPEKSLPYSDVLGNAPEKNSNYVVAPKVKK